MSGVKVIFGGAMIRGAGPFKTSEDVEALFPVLKKYDIKAIDTAQLYGDSELMLGNADAGSQFVIDTKWKGGFVPGSSTKEDIIRYAEESMKRLKMDKVSMPALDSCPTRET
jgi:aflatoxin B1 aldehyde reductase